MDAKTREALLGSIAKWERILVGTDSDQGAENCPLCQMFVVQTDHCGGCPIQQRTGQQWCDGTPYDQWHEVNPWPGGRFRIGASRAATSDEHRAVAQEELTFLKSLLPKDAKEIIS